MCEIATGILVVSAAIGAASSLKAGASAKSQADGEAALYQSQKAARLEKAEFDVATAERKYRRQAGQVVSRAGGSGISLDSFYDVLNDDAEEAALERAAIRWTANSEAKMLDYQSNAATSKGEDAQSASYINAAGAVVSAFGKYRAYKDKAPASPGVTMDDGGSAYGNVGNLK